MLQGQRDLATVGRMLLSELTPLVNAQQGVIYQMETEEQPRLKLLSAFADDGQDGHREHLADRRRACSGSARWRSGAC